MYHSSLYNKDYHSLLDVVLEQPEELNERTHTRIKALPGLNIGYQITDTLPLINTRKMFPVTAFAELCWTLSGERKLDWLQQHTKMWDGFKNDNNEVEAAYGYRWREMFGRDQLKEGLNALLKDPSDRQIFISAWDNSRDGLGNRWTTNVPCPTSFTLNIIDNKLNLSVFLRSSDMIVGLPYDMMMYGLLLIVCTNELKQRGLLNLQYGQVSAHLAHGHIYEPHYDIARMMISDYNKENMVKQDLDLTSLPILWRLLTVQNIIDDPDTAMRIFKDCAIQGYPTENRVYPPLYKPEVIK